VPGSQLEVGPSHGGNDDSALDAKEEGDDFDIQELQEE